MFFRKIILVLLVFIIKISSSHAQMIIPDLEFDFRDPVYADIVGEDLYIRDNIKIKAYPIEEPAIFQLPSFIDPSFLSWFFDGTNLFEDIPGATFAHDENLGISTGFSVCDLNSLTSNCEKMRVTFQDDFYSSGLKPTGFLLTDFYGATNANSEAEKVRVAVTYDTGDREIFYLDGENSTSNGEQYVLLEDYLQENFQIKHIRFSANVFSDYTGDFALAGFTATASEPNSIFLLLLACLLIASLYLLKRNFKK